MAGRGAQTFKKRQKEQQRKEKQEEKRAKRLQGGGPSTGGQFAGLDLDAVGPFPLEEFDVDAEPEDDDAK
jgi:hypothetical protein